MRFAHTYEGRDRIMAFFAPVALLALVPTWLILVALLIAYLPTMYAAFSKREAAVTLLEVRAGSPPSAVEMIGRYHSIHYNPDPHFPSDPISVTRAEFDQAWQNFAGWRVNYDPVLLALARLTMAPPAPWSSDRVEGVYLPPIVLLKRRK